MKINKTGMEPVIATTLLIVVTILLISALIFFVIPFIRDSLEKSQVCSDVKINMQGACNSGGISGTNNNARWDSLGVSNGAYFFNGVNSYINATNDSAFNFGTGDFTLDAWIYPTTDYAQGIISKWNGSNNAPAYWIAVYQKKITFAVYNQSSGELNYNNYIQSPDEITKNSWSHIVGVRKKISDTKENISLYINGVLKNSKVIALSNCDNSDALKIGVDSFYFPPWYLNGKVDEVKIYNRALASEEILQSYQNKEVYGEGLVSYWNLDNPSNIESIGIIKTKLGVSASSYQISKLIFGLKNDKGMSAREISINLSPYEEKQISVVGIENLQSIKVAGVVKKGTKEIKCDYGSELKNIGAC